MHRGKKVGAFVPFREPVVYKVKDGKGDLLKLCLSHVARFLETLAEEATMEINKYLRTMLGNVCSPISTSYRSGRRQTGQ